MKASRLKPIVDIISMIFSLVAIVTGFMLHKDVWHLHVFDNTTLWAIHEICGLVLLVLVSVHCCQHSFWFKNFAKIKANKKRVTSIFLIIGVIVAVSGIILMSGSHSDTISHCHYIGAIVFIILSIVHVTKRWKIFRKQLSC